MFRPAFALPPLFLLAVAAHIAAQGAEEPRANPARPTVSTPATLTPVGYFQIEAGGLDAWRSPEFAAQSSLNVVVKLAVTRRLELFAGAGPFAHSRVGNQTGNDAGDAVLGVQGVVHEGTGARPTIALSYSYRVYSGAAPNLDIGSARNSVVLLASADVAGFHCDANGIFNEVIDGGAHRAQFGQTLSISHPLTKNLGISGEIWRFTQPFLRGNAAGNLWALNYNVRPYLVLDAGFNRGLTSTSTRWEAFVGFTYLLPHRVLGNLTHTAAR
jgi:hypothetical protein